jgi:hypothetical protein
VGWHTSVRLRVPEHVHLLFLPAYSPELQPAEHLWPLTNTVLANHHFASIDQFERRASRALCRPASPPRTHPLGYTVPLVAEAALPSDKGHGTDEITASAAGAAG